MNKKLKRLWIAGLRGGTYQQVTGSFGDRDVLTGIQINNKRCAISILSEIMVRDGFTPKDMGAEAHRAMTMNDAGKSFIEIADWIEENL